MWCTVFLPHATEKWVSDGVLELRTAFSRDQPQKVYVQDLIVEDAKSLWNLLQVIFHKTKRSLQLSILSNDNQRIVYMQ